MERGFATAERTLQINSRGLLPVGGVFVPSAQRAGEARRADEVAMYLAGVDFIGQAFTDKLAGVAKCEGNASVLRGALFAAQANVLCWSQIYEWSSP